MAFADQVLHPDSLFSDSSGTYLSVGLPWFRSLPWGAVANLNLSVDGENYGPDEILVSPDADDHWTPLGDLAQDSREWFVQDRKTLRIQKSIQAGDHAIRLHFELVMPNLLINPNQPILVPSFVQKSITSH